MNVVRHDDPRVQSVVSGICSVADRRENDFSDFGDSEKSWPRASLIQQTIHCQESLTRSQIGGWKRPVRGKAVVETKGNEEGSVDDVEMREPTAVHTY